MGRLERVMGTNIIHCDQDEEIRLGHTWYEIERWDEIIERYSPEWFIEIGTHEGGFSWLMIPQHRQVNYMGVELYSYLIRPPVLKLYEQHAPRTVLHIGDCFDLSLKVGLSQLGRKIIYCDGGNKVQELHHFLSCLNPGDLLFSHDYWDGNRKVEEIPSGQVNCEVRPEDIADLDADPTLERYPESYLARTRLIGWRKK